jgi:hypothetical protein
MSFYTLAFTGTIPFGNLLAGGLASRIGAPHTLLLGGICCVVASIMFARKLPALRRTMRPVATEEAVITEVAQGIQLAATL